jgi:hypothetical protein
MYYRSDLGNCYRATRITTEHVTRLVGPILHFTITTGPYRYQIEDSTALATSKYLTSLIELDVLKK